MDPSIPINYLTILHYDDLEDSNLNSKKITHESKFYWNIKRDYNLKTKHGNLRHWQWGKVYYFNKLSCSFI